MLYDVHQDELDSLWTVT